MHQILTSSESEQDKVAIENLILSHSRPLDLLILQRFEY